MAFKQSAAAFLRENKAWMIAWSAAAILIILTVHFWPSPPSPVTSYIRTQASLAHFSVIYPQGYTVNPLSWKYLSSQGSVEFSVKKGGITIVFTEQATPLAYQDDQAAYERFIGSLRPRANFNVPLGTVSISNFVTQDDYQVVGDTGILNAQGTLLLAHPNAQMTDDQWRGLFESLKVD